MLKTRGAPIFLATGLLIGQACAFLSPSPRDQLSVPYSSVVNLHMSSTTATAVPSWEDLTSEVANTEIGQALNKEVEIRKEGKGSAHVQNKLRQFGKDESPQITLYRDHAGW